MKNYLKKSAPVGLAILLGSLTFLFAQTKTVPDEQFPKGEKREFGRISPPPRPGFAPDALNPRLFEQLNLSDEQKQQIRVLQETARSESEVYFETLEVLREKIKDTTETESFDEGQARKLLKTRAEIQIELEIIRLKTDSAVYNLLTAEQIAKLGLLKAERREFRPEMPPPPPPQD